MILTIVVTIKAHSRHPIKVHLIEPFLNGLKVDSAGLFTAYPVRNLRQNLIYTDFFPHLPSLLDRDSEMIDTLNSIETSWEFPGNFSMASKTPVLVEMTDLSRFEVRPEENTYSMKLYISFLHTMPSMSSESCISSFKKLYNQSRQPLVYTMNVTSDDQGRTFRAEIPFTDILELHERQIFERINTNVTVSKNFYYKYSIEYENRESACSEEKTKTMQLLLPIRLANWPLIGTGCFSKTQCN